MPDQNTDTNTDKVDDKKNTPGDDLKNTENMIPKSRFDQLNQQKKAAETTLQEIADEFVNDIPEDFRDIVPNLAPAEKIKWIKSAQKKGLFTKQNQNSPDSKAPNKSKLDFSNMKTSEKIKHGYKT
jgi:hypothetical protein